MERSLTIRAIVVDDEPNARKILPVLVDWRSYGYEFVGEASNGYEALDLIDTAKPDVVFADINMPSMDGLELSRLIKERYPLIKVVIITAHQEFGYAKRSVELGVSDFLLKPLQPEEVTALAVKLRGEIEEEVSHWSEYRQMKEQLAESAAVLRERFVNELLAGSDDPESLSRRYAYFFPDRNGVFRGLALLEAHLWASDDEEDRLLAGIKCVRFTETLLANNETVDILRDAGGRIVLISHGLDTDLSLVAERCVRAIEEKLGLKVSAGLGRPITSFDSVSICYREALEAIRYGKMQGSGQVISFGEDISLVREEWSFPKKEIDELIFYVKTGAKDQVRESVDGFFSSLYTAPGMTMELARNISVYLLSLLTNTVAALGLQTSLPELRSVSHFSKTFQATTIAELHGLFQTLGDDVCLSIRESRTTKKETMVDRVKEYLNREFADPNLSLTQVSGEVNHNASYLSRVFKQETGTSFTDYLLRLRMEAAARLFDETDLKAYQIAEEVGIKDPYYFSSCFKKVMGIPPLEYKKAYVKNSQD